MSFFMRMFGGKKEEQKKEVKKEEKKEEKPIIPAEPPKKPAVTESAPGTNYEPPSLFAGMALKIPAKSSAISHHLPQEKEINSPNVLPHPPIITEKPKSTGFAFMKASTMNTPPAIPLSPPTAPVTYVIKNYRLKHHFRSLKKPLEHSILQKNLRIYL